MIWNIQLFGIMRYKLVAGTKCKAYTRILYLSLSPSISRCWHHYIWFCFKQKETLDFGESVAVGFESQFCYLTALWLCTSSFASMNLGVVHKMGILVPMSCYQAIVRIDSRVYWITRDIEGSSVHLAILPHPPKSKIFKNFHFFPSAIFSLRFSHTHIKFCFGLPTTFAIGCYCLGPPC